MTTAPIKPPERVDFGENGFTIERVIKGAGQHLLAAVDSVDWEDERRRAHLVEDVHDRLTSTMRMVEAWLEARGE